jgi:hypothetical protein
LVLFQIVLDGVSFIDVWVWESDGSGIVSDDVRNLVGSDGFLDDFTELEVGFGSLDADEGESALFIIQKSIVLSSFDDVEDIHDADWEFKVSSDLVIDLKSCLLILGDNGDLFTVSSQSQSVPGVIANCT